MDNLVQEFLSADDFIVISRFQLRQMIIKRVFGRNLTIAYQFSTRQKESLKADSLLKAYYSTRLVINPDQYQHYLKKLSTCYFKEEDHRWQSLTKNIELHTDSFDSNSQVTMLKSLVDLRSRSSLIEALTQKLATKVNTLTLQEIAIFLWCLGKFSSRSKPDLLIGIFKRINQLLLPQIDTIPPIVIRKQFIQEDTEIKHETIAIGATTLSMLITGMGNLGIVDKPLLKRIIKDAIRPNLKDFYVQTLCTFMIAFQKLHLTSRRDTLEVYKAIRNKAKDLQNAQIQTLFNLMGCMANISKRSLSQNQIAKLEKYKDEKEKIKEQEADMKKFFLWIWETILLREPKLSCAEVALMLMNASKIKTFDEQLWRKSCLLLIDDIKEAKIIDLVMVVKALASLSKDKRELLQKEEEHITSRLWNLSSSINGKSLATLAELFRRKRLQAPPKMAKKFQEYWIQEQKKQRELARTLATSAKAENQRQN